MKNLRTLTIVLTCLLLPLTMLAGVLATAFYKSTNPDTIDITTSLAYLRQTMTVAIVTFAVIVAAISGLIFKMYRRDRNFSQAKLPIVLLAATLGTIGIIMVVNSYTDSVQEQYRRDHGRATLQEFFDALDKQKNK